MLTSPVGLKGAGALSVEPVLLHQGSGFTFLVPAKKISENEKMKGKLCWACTGEVCLVNLTVQVGQTPS